MADGRTILFLGAGASVTDKKKFLSKQIIELYSDKAGVLLDTEDITEFVDTLSSSAKFSRDEFDQFVADLLSKLKVDETHKTIASINWKEIITTNFDLLLEKAFDESRVLLCVSGTRSNIASRFYPCVR
jgi:predicted nucleic-acid-binding protein